VRPLRSFVSEEDVAPFMARFDAMDTDGSGRLTHDDLLVMVQVRTT